MKRPSLLFALPALYALPTILGACATSRPEVRWPQFRGPDSTGHATEELPLVAEFGPDHHLIWKRSVAPGHSSPCIWDDRIFLTGSESNRLQTICIDRITGTIRWTQSVEPAETEKIHRINSLASPTPTTDGERVFAYFGSYGLVCYDLDGEEQWRRVLSIPNNTFGTATSPIAANGRLFFVNDENGSSYVEAIDPSTGQTIWKTERPDFGSGWSTPVLISHNGQEELIVYGVWWLSSYDPASGAQRWAVPGLADEPCITPVAGSGLIYVSSYNMKTNPEVIGLPSFDRLLTDYDTDGNGRLSQDESASNKSILSRADADGEGDHPLRGFFRYLDENRDDEITASEWAKIIAWVDSFRHANALVAIRPGGVQNEAEIMWQHHRGIPECPSPLYYDGHVYLIKNGGMVTCIEAESGAVRYFERLGSGGPYYASPVVGDGKIYTASARGVVTVFAAGPQLNVLAHNDLGERIMATPALAGGRIYVRTEQHLYAFGRS